MNAETVAQQAAASAGVQIRLVEDVDGIARVAGFFAQVWRTSEEPLPAETLRSLVHAGGSIIGAYADGRLAGAAVAVFEPPRERAVYSLLAGTSSSDRGVGFALKQAQRVWALREGAQVMSWTFDPLVGRNARFNMAKLGAVGTEYLVDFYGPMNDGLNAGDESDRVTARWDLSAAAPALEHDREGALSDLTAPDGKPLTAHRDDLLFCRVPADIVELRGRDPEAAIAWRKAVRDVFIGAFDRGYRVVGMSRDGWYTLRGADS
ncbi:Predicted acetyltransferase, GNAT superfamily [Amycolatopsis xylanica]|uniref:Predicted acetyltransferase, GNAT superfamily n=1 Tax=Amycolatopsis xylanica TaxID=589385 RepID=A0A1H3JFT8_9PSEU|nr:chorismate synthase [Amycolatopsis xylanica]SDY38806.1 Predicted acetyltransferase, GNAT superfamily [Amycolatopsis xylanica]